MTAAQTPQDDRVGLGIGLILVSVLAMAFADAMVKLVSADLTLWQVFVTRSLVALPILLVAARLTRITLRPKAPRWVLARSGLLVLTWLVFYASLPVLDLSVAAVAVYTNPIMTALLSAAVNGERVRGRQWAGVLLGFLGVFAILQPGSDTFSWFTLVPMLAAFFYALAMVLTRSRCREEAPVVLALGLHASFLATGLVATLAIMIVGLGPATIAASPFLLAGWQAMGAGAWGLMLLLGALSAAYFLGVARAYQIAPSSVIATFDYAYLVWAALWGFVLFAETPGPLTFVGMALITAAGFLVANPRASAGG